MKNPRSPSSGIDKNLGRSRRGRSVSIAPIARRRAGPYGGIAPRWCAGQFPLLPRLHVRDRLFVAQHHLPLLSGWLPCMSRLSVLCAWYIATRSPRWRSFMSPGFFLSRGFSSLKLDGRLCSDGPSLMLDGFTLDEWSCNDGRFLSSAISITLSVGFTFNAAQTFAAAATWRRLRKYAQSRFRSRRALRFRHRPNTRALRRCRRDSAAPRRSAGQRGRRWSSRSCPAEFRRGRGRGRVPQKSALSRAFSCRRP